jgi:hypothetical protein
MPRDKADYWAKVDARRAAAIPVGPPVPVRTIRCLCGCGRSVLLLDGFCDVARGALPEDLRWRLDRAQRRGSWAGRSHDVAERLAAEDAVRAWLLVNPVARPLPVAS